MTLDIIYLHATYSSLLPMLLKYYSESKPQPLKHMTYSVTFVRSRSTYGIDVTADGRITALCDEDYHRRYHLSTLHIDRVLSPSAVDLFYQRQMMMVYVVRCMSTEALSQVRMHQVTVHYH